MPWRMAGKGYNTRVPRSEDFKGSAALGAALARFCSGGVVGLVPPYPFRWDGEFSSRCRPSGIPVSEMPGVGGAPRTLGAKTRLLLRPGGGNLHAATAKSGEDRTEIIKNYAKDADDASRSSIRCLLSYHLRNYFAQAWRCQRPHHHHHHHHLLSGREWGPNMTRLDV